MKRGDITNAFTIDFEDWYQGLEIPYSEWGKFEDRIEAVGDRLIRILDDAGVKATFFVVGVLCGASAAFKTSRGKDGTSDRSPESRAEAGASTQGTGQPPASSVPVSKSEARPEQLDNR